MYAVAHSHIAERAGHLAESLHGQLPFKRGKASSVLKTISFPPKETLVERYSTLLTTKCLFFPVSQINKLGLQRPISEKEKKTNASTDDC